MGGKLRSDDSSANSGREMSKMPSEKQENGIYPDLHLTWSRNCPLYTTGCSHLGCPGHGILILKSKIPINMGQKVVALIL